MVNGQLVPAAPRHGRNTGHHTSLATCECGHFVFLSVQKHEGSVAPSGCGDRRRPLAVCRAVRSEPRRPPITGQLNVPRRRTFPFTALTMRARLRRPHALPGTCGLPRRRGSAAPPPARWPLSRAVTGAGRAVSAGDRSARRGCRAAPPAAVGDGWQPRLFAERQSSVDDGRRVRDG